MPTLAASLGELERVQSELAEENVLTNVRSVFQVAPAESKMAQVCIAFVYAYTAGNSDNGWTVRQAGLLPVVAYHHLRGRDKKTRESKEALVSLGAAVEPLPCEQRRAPKDAFDAARRIRTICFGATHPLTEATARAAAAGPRPRPASPR